MASVSCEVYVTSSPVWICHIVAHVYVDVRLCGRSPALVIESVGAG